MRRPPERAVVKCEKFKIIIETGIAGGDFEDEFEVDDDATPDEIHDEAKDIFFNYCKVMTPTY
ncbi:hypothetical protein [Escherichia coli]|uniref:DUF7167 family protein n=1 Tax=Escherichia coli TaxID=562 RepID=UPI0028936BD4|nr:hypothetical protein [Escherichia coli]